MQRGRAASPVTLREEVMKNLCARSSTWLSLAGLALLSASCSPPTPRDQAGGKPEVVVGANLELSGDIAQWGLESRYGMEMAAEEIGRDPKNNFRLKLVFEDNKSEDSASKAAISKLIRQHGAKVVVGSVASNKTTAAIDVAQEERVALVTHASTNVDITRKGGEYVFRICFNDDVQSRVMARYALDELKARTAVLIVQRGNVYSEGLVDSFMRFFTEGGGKVLDTLAFQRGDTDFQTMAVRLRTADPDVVWLPGYFNEVALIVKQARGAGFQKVFLGGDGWDEPALYTLGGPAIKDNFFCNHFDPADGSAKVQDFVRRYENRHGKKPGAMAALGYDVIYCVADAARRAGKADAEAIKNALATIKDLEVVCGRVTMGADHEVTKPIVLLKTGEKGHIFAKRL